MALLGPPNYSDLTSVPRLAHQAPSGGSGTLPRAEHPTLDHSKLDSAWRARGDFFRSRRRGRTVLLGAVVGLLIALLRVSKVQLDFERLPEGDAKRMLLRAIKPSEKDLPLSAALRIRRLSASRNHSGCRAAVGCELDDQPSCPRVVPTRLTPAGIENVQTTVESDDHRDISLRALALHAQRIERSSPHPRRGIGWS